MADRFPLAAQQGIWAGQQMDPASPMYNCGEYVSLPGPVDVPRLRAAIGADVSYMELSGMPAAEDWMWASLSSAGENLGSQHTVIRLGKSHHLWFHQAHHISLDGYAFALIAHEVAARYSGLPTKEFGSLDAVIAEEAAYDPVPDRDFWLSRLDGVDAAGPGVALAWPPLRVSKTLKLDPLSAIAAVAGYAARQDDADEVVLGLPVMNRAGSAAARVPCMWMNIVPLRVAIGDSLASTAAGVRAELSRIRPHQRYRYEQLRMDLGWVGQRMFGPVVNVLPFRSTLRFGEIEGTVHHVAAGPVEDLSFVMAGDQVTLEADPNRHCIADLESILDGLITEPFRRRTIIGGAALSPPAAPVLSLLDAVPAERIAVAASETHAAVSYGGLRSAVADLAARLAAAGAGPRRLIAVELPRSLDAIVAILAVLRTGAAYLPLDPQSPPARRQAILADARPAVLISDRITPLPEPGEVAAEAAYVIYTSGSTGTPNGVVIGQPALAHFVSAATSSYGIAPDDHVLQFAPLHFDASVEELFLTLCAGATLVLRPGEISVSSLLEFCALHQITVLDLPTAYWHELAHYLGAGAGSLPGSIRTVIIGGEAALPERVARWHSVVSRDVRLLNTYGPTETTVVATVAELSAPRPAGAAEGDSAEDAVPIGRPLPGVRAAIRSGELWLLGPTLALGYLGKESERFATLDGERAYRTGDLVRLGADGQMYFAGRRDDELKISGHRIDPASVESVLLQHSEVGEAAVIGHGGRLIAFYTTESGDLGDLRGHVAKVLPGPAVPGSFVRVDRLPRTSTGKIDRRALALYETPAADVQAATATERVILSVWRELLGSLSAMDDFFARGGQSLQAIAAAARLSVILGRAVPASLIFAYPTALLLGSYLDDEHPSEVDYRADAQLAPLAMAHTRPACGTVLLTGATGFVGSHLLAELPGRIICPVRGPASRLWETLRRWKIDVPDFAERVMVTDFDEPFGPVDAIFHCAASVSVMRGYRSLRASNVELTRTLLMRGARHGAAFHHLSTVAVAGPLTDGYQQSKWVAERLVLQAHEQGLPVAIYRLGRVTGSTVTALPNPDDLVWRVVRAGLAHGMLPDLDVTETWTPVNEVARNIAELSADPSGQIHTIAPHPPVSLRSAFEWCIDYGLPVRTVPVAHWPTLMRTAGYADDGILSFFDNLPELPVFHGITHDARQLMYRYLDSYLKENPC